VTVVPNGVGETAGVTDAPGTGVTVTGAEVGLGVGLGVAVGGGGGGVGAGVAVGAGVGVGAVTTTGFGASVLGLLSAVVVELNLTVQVPTGRVDEPLQVPDSGGSTVDMDTVRVVEPLEATAVTVIAVSVALPLNSTENAKTVVVVPINGVTAP